MVEDVRLVERFTTGTTCKIASENDEEWIMEISEVFQVEPVDNKYFIFVNETYFIPTLNNGNTIYHPWVQTPQLISRNYIIDSIRPACKIKRKVIMYPDPSDLHNPFFYLCIDFKKPELINEVHVPVYTSEGETIHILGADNEDWFGLVQQVDYEAREASVKWYAETRRQGVWVLTNQQDNVHFSSILNVCQVNRTFGGYNIA